MCMLNIIGIIVFTLISADASQVLLQTLNSVHPVTIQLFCQPSKHRGSTSKCEKYVAVLNYWSGAHKYDLSPHTHTWDVFCSVYSQIGLNERCWSMKMVERSVKPCWWEIGWSRSPHGCDALATTTKSLSAGPPLLQSTSRSLPVNTNYPRLSRSLLPCLSSSCKP